MFESPNVTEDETGLTVTQDSPSPKQLGSDASKCQILKGNVREFEIKTLIWSWIDLKFGDGGAWWRDVDHNVNAKLKVKLSKDADATYV